MFRVRFQAFPLKINTCPNLYSCATCSARKMAVSGFWGETRNPHVSSIIAFLPGEVQDPPHVVGVWSGVTIQSSWLPFRDSVTLKAVVYTSSSQSKLVSSNEKAMIVLSIVLLKSRRICSVIMFTIFYD